MPSNVDYAALRQGGIIKQGQPDLFAIRIRILLGNVSSDQAESLARIAKKYGDGTLHLTMRQCIEIPHVHFNDITGIEQELAGIGFKLGVCGPRVRVITACMGTICCSSALNDTAKLVTSLDERYYGRGPLPHKFKMAVTGCPNSCVKPQENDLGFIAAVKPGLRPEECIGCGLCERACKHGAVRIENDIPVIDHDKCAHDGRCIQVCPTGALYENKKGWHICLGGKIGSHPQLGITLGDFLSDEESVDLVGQVLNVYGCRAKKQERLGDLINRIGIENFKEAIEYVRVHS